MVILSTRKRPNWLKDPLEDVKGHGVAKGTLRERKRPKMYSGYVSYMKKIVEEDPSTFEENAHQEVWKKSM